MLSIQVLKIWLKRHYKLTEVMSFETYFVTILACVTWKMLGKEMLNHLNDVEQYYKWW